MRCPSVAGIWSGSFYPHEVTAAAVFTTPSALYTGGADGSIVWWSIYGSGSNMEIKPVALLCGHVSPVGSLSACSPCPSFNSGAFISGCSDGILCVWSRGSGHCRLRRKLPYWAGSPYAIKTLPSYPRYVCVASCLTESDHLSGQNSSTINSVEGPEHHRKETQLKQSSTCSLFIVDSYTLSISHIVFQGILSVEFLKSMHIFPFSENEEALSVAVVDSHARLQVFLIRDNFQEDGVTDVTMHEIHPQYKIITYEEELNGYGQVLYVTICGKFVAFVYNTCCIFKLLNGGAKMGKICFGDAPFFRKEGDTHTHVGGCLFFENDIDGINKKNHMRFAAWSKVGFTVVFLVSYLDGVFAAEPWLIIPPVSIPSVERLSVRFVMLGSFLLRLESVPFFVQASTSLYNSHITMWSLHNDNQTLRECEKIGDGGSDHVTDSGSVKNTGTDSNRDFVYNMVSSSMVIFQKFPFPSAIIHGYYSGVIELIPVDILHPDICDENAIKDSALSMTRIRFCGHEGAVLCLATHEMVGAQNGRNFKKVLISGGMDCTVRVWDLECGNSLSVMHQHVSPVRQIVLRFLPTPLSTPSNPWDDCFLSVGEDACVALVSLVTLHVERMFPGHPPYPLKVIWDGVRGYVACFFKHRSGHVPDVTDYLYIWDVKTGVRERVLKGVAASLTLDHFYKNILVNSKSDSRLNSGTSTSSLNFPILDDEYLMNSEIGVPLSRVPVPTVRNGIVLNSYGLVSTSKTIPGELQTPQGSRHPIESSCLFPGICCLSFDLGSTVSFFQKSDSIGGSSSKVTSSYDGDGIINFIQDCDWINSLKGLLLRFSLTFLHLWDVDTELDNILASDMKLKRPAEFVLTSGLQGDNGAFTVAFPGLNATIELCKLSAEFSAMRSLTMLSLSQCMASGFKSSSALSAFYTRNFAEKILHLKPPLLQLLVSFWNDKSEHVREAAHTLFHCFTSHAIPHPLCSETARLHGHFTNFPTEIIDSSTSGVNVLQISSSYYINPNSEIGVSEPDDSSVLSWLEAYEAHDWISCVGGTSQDAMTSHIIVAAALAVWYPGLVKSSLPKLVVHMLIKLVMSMNEKYSSTAAELLAEGMDNTWKGVLASEISRLISDIFFQIECVSSISDNPVSRAVGDTLVGVLLPSLAMADMHAFLNVVESQIWSTASDSPVHLVSLMTVLRVMRFSLKSMTNFIDKVVNFVLQTMDPGNSVMRKTCFQSAVAVLKEVAQKFPTVAFNGAMTKLAVGDAVCDVRNARISIYDVQSTSKLKLLDASCCGPPGFPNLLSRGSESTINTAISAISFSPDGEGLVAFSEMGLIIRWWSLGSVWWEKMSRNFVPCQCTKLIFVPPWEGLSPHSSRSSIISSVMENDVDVQRQEEEEIDKCGIQNMDLSYRLEWAGQRNVILSREGQELGTFLLL